MKTDLEKTIHYTTEAEQICSNLLSYIPKDAQLIEPFVGAGDLLSLFPNHSWEKYDLLPQEDAEVIVQDTLRTPPDYTYKLMSKLYYDLKIDS